MLVTPIVLSPQRTKVHENHDYPELSSNDGACIARSNEAKELVVQMAQPWFQARHLQKSHGLVTLSANFELYSDLSARMMAIASR